MKSNWLKYKKPGETPFCVQACPAGINIPRYIRFIGEGKFAEALSVIREKIPFPSVCGYVCPHPCEDACQTNKRLAKPIAIRALKRFVTDRNQDDRKSSIAHSTGKRIAIVGSGPAGLTAAYYLTKLGHKLTVYESLHEPGGMMKFGIPRFVLPSDVLDREIGAILNLGVELKLNSPVKELGSLREKGYDAIFLATGLQAGKKLPIPGTHFAGVLTGLSFLRDINMGKEVEVGQKVAVIGGGNVAIDTARTALRLGAKEVTIIYRRSRHEMPAYEENVKGAEAEGIKFQFLASPTKVLSEGEKIASLGCIRTQLGEADVSGRKRPIPIQGSDFFVEVDTVILAIGQASDLSFLQGTKIRTAIEGTIQVDSISLQTSKIGTFSGGDIVTGAASVIEAISAGRRAASSIDKYLGGKGELSEGIVSEEKVSPPMQGFPVGKRNEGRLLPVEDRLKGFALVDTGFSSEEEAISEAKRCLRCDLPIIVDTSKCTSCLTCSLYCSFVGQGIFNPMKAQVRVRTSLEEANSISFTDDCDNCGICARYCPYGALAR